jgi:uncharacterized protein (TIGR02099 family)
MDNIKKSIKTVYRISGTLIIMSAIILLAARSFTSFITIDPFLPDNLQYDKAKIVWEGWQPGIRLYNVVIDEPFEAKFRRVTVILNWPASLIGREWRLKKISIKGVRTDIPFEGKATPLLDLGLWHLVQRELRANWKRCPIFIVEDVSVGSVQQARLILTFGDTLNIRGAGQIVQIEPIDINFGVSLKDWMSQKDEVDGLLYFNVFGLPLADAVSYFPSIGLPHIDKGRTSLEAWTFLKDNEPARGAIQFEGFDIQISDEKDRNHFDYVKGNLNFVKSNSLFELWGKKIHFFKTAADRRHIKQTLPTEFNLKLGNDDIEFKAHALGLSNWRPFLSSFVFLPKPLKMLLTNYQPAGYLNFLHFKVDAAYQPIFVRGQVEKLSLVSSDRPGFKGLSGVFVYKNKIGRIDIQDDQLSLNHPALFEGEIKFNNFNSKIWWDEGQPHIERTIWLESATGTVRDATFFASMKYSMQPESDLDLYVEVKDLLMQDFLALMPKPAINPPLITWLDDALEAGKIESANLRLKGLLNQFPFVDNSGIFIANGKFTGASLAYAPDWPELSDLNGSIKFDRQMMSIQTTAGYVGTSPLKAQAWIKDLTAPVHALTVQAEVQSTLEKGLNVVNHSPLADTLGKTLQPFSLAGAMILSLKLDIPLAQHHTAQPNVKGVISVLDANFNVNDWKLNIEHIKGDISFTESSLDAPRLIGQLLGSEAQFSVKSDVQHPYSQVQVKATGMLQPGAIANWANSSKFNAVTGESPYEANLIFSSKDNHDTGHITIKSDLIGLNVNLPEPFDKEKKDVQPSKLKVYFEPNGQLRLKGQYGDRISFALSLKDNNNDWMPLGGQLYFGTTDTAKNREDGIFKINGHITKFDLLNWTNQTDAQLDLDPMIDLDIALLRIGNFDFDHVEFQGRYNSAQKQWLHRFNGKMIDGIALLPDDQTKAIQLDLDHLALISDNHIKNTQPIKPSTRKIDATVKSINYNGKLINDLRLIAQGDGTGYHIRELKARSYQTVLNSSGYWEPTHVILNGTALSRNVSRFLEKWGYNSSLKDASGKMAFNLDWEIDQDGIDLSSLNGTIEATLNKGYIHGVDPGLGRILSLISLDSIQRRLQLDFTDLSKDGLSFDKMAGNFNIHAGRINTKDLYLDGSAARVELNGALSLPSKSIEANIGVLPNLTAGLPIAAAIAVGNPAVGAAVWLVDKLIGRQLKEITRYEYQVSGTLTEPQITESKRS